MDAGIGKSWHAGLDFALSQQVLATPDFESSHLRDRCRTPNEGLHVAFSAWDPKISQTFSPQEPPPAGVVVTRSVKTSDVTGDGAHLGAGAICHSPEICVLVAVCVCVCDGCLCFNASRVTPAHLERIIRTSSVLLEMESREKVIVVSTLLSNFLPQRIDVEP